MQIDLQRGVVPISRAASSLAALLKRCTASGQPIVITQKGYPTGVLLSIDIFTELSAIAERTGAFDEIAAEALGEPAAEPAAEPVAEPEPAPTKRRARKTA